MLDGNDGTPDPFLTMYLTTGALIASTAQTGEAVITDANIANLNADKLMAAWLNAARLAAGHLDVDNLLTIQSGAGLKHRRRGRLRRPRLPAAAYGIYQLWPGRIW